MRCLKLRYTRAVLVYGLIIVIALALGVAQAATFKTVGGEAVIEAEDFTKRAGTLGGEWSIASVLPNFKGLGYIQATTEDPPTLQFRSNIMSVEYEIDFRQTGTYYLHLRTYAEDETQNGFFATINGTQIDYGNDNSYYIFVKQMTSNTQWHWYSDGGGEGKGHRGYKLSFNIETPGTRTLAIYRRDKGSRIDRIWITKHTSEPQDVGSLSLNDPNTFILTPNDERCGDGLDNDGNGLTDCDDSACETHEACIPESACDDGIDNDFDELIDCQDTDCGSYAGCLPEGECGDGTDDDFDGLTDCDDPDCSEYGGCNPEGVCNDGVDDDFDGQTDCDDSDCESHPACNPEIDCSNGIDDDLDGKTDCDDSDCLKFDEDEDKTADCQDAFPQDPKEWKDTDNDGSGDNADEDDDNDTLPDSEEKGMKGDVSDYDGNSDGTPDAIQNSVISFHSESGLEYLTIAISDPGRFTQLTTHNVSTLSSAPEGASFGYDLCKFGVSVGQKEALAEMTFYLPEGDTVDAVYMFGPTPDDKKDHWYRFDFDEKTKTGAQIKDNVVTLHIKDGQRGDHDLEANGEISTYLGPANLATVDNKDGGKDGKTPSNVGGSGGGGGGGGCFILSLDSSLP